MIDLQVRGVVQFFRLTNRNGDMIEVLTARMSSKGQVVIPEPFRSRYGWGPNTSFTFTALDGSLIMQPVVVPKESDLRRLFGALIRKCREDAMAAGLTPADIEETIAEVRAERRQKRPATSLHADERDA